MKIVKKSITLFVLLFFVVLNFVNAQESQVNLMKNELHKTQEEKKVTQEQEIEEFSKEITCPNGKSYYISTGNTKESCIKIFDKDGQIIVGGQCTYENHISIFNCKDGCLYSSNNGICCLKEYCPSEMEERTTWLTIVCPNDKVTSISTGTKGGICSIKYDKNRFISEAECIDEKNIARATCEQGCKFIKNKAQCCSQNNCSPEMLYLGIYNQDTKTK